MPHPPLRVSLLAAAMALSLPLLAPPARAQSAATGAIATDLPAGPLGRSLSLFASQRGMALSFDPDLVEGLQAPAISGVVGDEAGLQRLLQGTGLRAVRRADGSHGIETAPAPRAGSLPLSPLRVGADRSLPYAGGVTIGQDEIESSIKGNGDLGTLLRTHPSVQFSDTASSRMMGEIRPADISINGAAFYQNLFLLDGAGINNDIDPASTPDSIASVNAISDVASQSQGIAVDTDLIKRVTVHDSNVPAAFGGFTGGVVEAESRDATDGLHGKVWMRMARSAWDEVLMADGQQDNYAESATFVYQPRYDKEKLGVRLEGRTRGGVGLIGTVTRTRSEIPLRGYTAGNTSTSDSNQKTQTRQNTAVSLAADWRSENGLELGANLTYAPTDDRYFIINQKDSWFDIRSGGPVLSLRANKTLGAWLLRNTLSYSDVESARRSEVDYRRQWAKSPEKDWGTNDSSHEGSWGNIDQNDRKLSYRLLADRDTFDLGNTTHDVQLGFSYQHRDVHYERLNNQYNYQDPMPTTGCTFSDGSEDSASCSLSPVYRSKTRGVIAGQGQYLSTLMLYEAGRFQVRGDEWSTWLQDDIHIGDVSLRPGLRLDGDDIWNRTTLSPRLAASWDVGGTQSTVVTAGLNRYYGRNFFTYLLREGRERLQVTKERADSATRWEDVTGSRGGSLNRITDLDIPHSDEWTLGIAQQWAGMQFNLKRVDRRSRDEVRRQRVESGDAGDFYDSRVYEYTNNGTSRSRTWTLSVSPRNALAWGRSSTVLQFAADHTEVLRNYADYDEVWTLAKANELVLYKGKVHPLYDLPATTFTRPWTVRLSTSTTLPLGPGELSLSNFLRYRSGFRDLGRVGEGEYQGEPVDVYDDIDYPDSFTWDASLQYALALPRAQEVYLRVEAANVLNRSTLTRGTTPASSYFEPGRSYWLELGYRF